MGEDPRGEGRLDLDLRGWAEGTRKMLAFQLVLRGSLVREFNWGGKGRTLTASKKLSLTLQIIEGQGRRLNALVRLR